MEKHIYPYRQWFPTVEWNTICESGSSWQSIGKAEYLSLGMKIGEVNVNN